MVKALRSCLEAAKGKIKAGHLILRKSPKRTATGSSTASKTHDPHFVFAVLRGLGPRSLVFSGSQAFPDHRQKIFRTLPITGNKYFVLYLTGSLVFPDHRQKIFRTLPITGNKYFVLYLTGSLVFPDHRQKIFRTLPITGKKYFVLYLRWLGEGNFLVQILSGGSVIGHD